MECSYQKGECSICGHSFTNRNQICSHLRSNKGKKINDKEVFEVMKGIKFTGVALLDSEGADKNAKIVEKAKNIGEIKMENNFEIQVEDEFLEEANNKNSDELEKENNFLKEEIKKLNVVITKLQEKLSLLVDQQKQEACLQRANSLVNLMIKKGLDFEKKTEVESLKKLSDEAFEAVKRIIEKVPLIQSKNS